MPYELKMVVANEVAYIVLAACEVVVEADNIVAILEKALA